jgi:hypothetical protein
LLCTDRDGPRLLLLLLHAGVRQDAVGSSARNIINCLLADIFSQVHNMPKHRTEEVSIFSGMSSHLPTIQQMLLVEDTFQLSASSQLLSLYCLHKGRSVSAQLLRFLVASCTKDQQLTVVVQVVGQLEQFHTNMVGEAVSTGLKDKKTNIKVFLSNLAKLTQLEAGLGQSWVRAVTGCQPLLVEFLVRPDLTGLVLDLYRIVPSATNMRVNTLHKICHGFVQVILNTITSTNLSMEDSTARISSCEKILLELCKQHCGLQVTLR